MGEVVITDLNNYCMPFIRYRIGDLAEAMDPAEPCACGRGLPRIGKHRGARAVDHRRLATAATCRAPSSRTCSRTTTTRSGSSRSCRTSAARSTFKVVKGPRFSDEAFGEVLATLRQFLGEDMRIDVEFVDNIDMVRTGKHQAAISHLPIDLQRDDVRLGSATGG